MVNIPVVIALFNDDGFVVVPMITVAYDVTVAIPVTISVPLSNRYANRTNTDPNLFRSSRYRAANSSHGGDHYGIPNHCVLLSLLNSRRQYPDARIVPYCWSAKVGGATKGRRRDEEAPRLSLQRSREQINQATREDISSESELNCSLVFSETV